MERPDFFTLKNGEKAKLPFSDKEYKLIKESFPKSTFGNSNGNNTNIPPTINQNKQLRSTNFGPNPAPLSEDESELAKRPAFTNIDNKFPSNQGNSMFNRFQNLFKMQDNFGNVPSNSMSDSDCLRQLVFIANDIQLMIKIIMFIVILFFIIKILEKKY